MYIHTILGITQQQLPAFEQRINSFVINPMGNTASDRTCLRPVASGEAKGMLRSTCCAKPLGWTRWGTGLKGKCYRQQNVFSRLQSPMVVLQFLSTKKQEMKPVLLTQDWKGLSHTWDGPMVCRRKKHQCWNHYHPLSTLVGGFNPSEKYESQLGWLFQIYGKNKKAVSPRKTTITVNIWGKKQVLFAAPELNRIRIDAPFSRNPSRLVARSTKPKTNCKVQKS